MQNFIDRHRKVLGKFSLKYRISRRSVVKLTRSILSQGNISYGYSRRRLRRYIGDEFEHYHRKVFGANSLGTYIYTSMQHAIDRKAIRSGLSVVPFITLPGSLLRENPPARLPMESPHRVYGFFLSSSPTVFSYPSYSSYLFFPSQQTRFPQMQKIARREMFDPDQSQRACDGSKYFHTRCTFSYSWQTSVTRLLLDDVEPSFSMAITIK